jgi:hypothetical protein
MATQFIRTVAQAYPKLSVSLSCVDPPRETDNESTSVRTMRGVHA